ncbi:uncharacterized protein LOC111344826 isoform X2 [Stylophora pistillata]|uniref:Coagulation factor VIII n=2 Tax=Stylophora pistillata TaxID=50429 RepID=A0A2B4RDI1_STYPI|nr:uncharacterized protein LOC111344826 isoform X2 [Stylophora pistillata]PFX14397.1 Coagulation factor VIII [Stylophora pistillata]
MKTTNNTKLKGCAETSVTSSYIEINLHTLHTICAVSAHEISPANKPVKNYTIRISTNGSTWEDYKENGKVKIFQGYNEKTLRRKHDLKATVTARYLRFLPAGYQGHVCMTTEIFGKEKIAVKASSSTTSRASNTERTNTPSATEAVTTEDSVITTIRGVSTTAETPTSSAAETVAATNDSGIEVTYTPSRASTPAGTNTSAADETTTTEDNGKQQLYLLILIALSVIVLVLFVIIGGLIWQLRKGVRRNEDYITDHDIPVPPVVRQESEPIHYMELRPPEVQSPEPSAYASLQRRYSTPYYCNVGFVREKTGNDNDRIYENVEAGGIGV